MFGSFGSLCSPSSDSPAGDELDERDCVVVNVYDMRAENRWSSVFGVGVWHTGVQLYGAFEVTFGGHPGDFTGVFTLPPRSVPLPVFESINLGPLNKSLDEVRHILETMAAEYTGNSYHILYRNCNHFSDDLVTRLVGKPLPSYINRLAGLASLVKCVLPQSLRGPHFEDRQLVIATSDPALAPASQAECPCCHRCRDTSSSSPLDAPDHLRAQAASPFLLGGEDMGPLFLDDDQPEQVADDPAIELLRQVFFPTSIEVSA